jgi:hypothetical protein
MLTLLPETLSTAFASQIRVQQMWFLNRAEILHTQLLWITQVSLDPLKVGEQGSNPSQIWARHTP